MRVTVVQTILVYVVAPLAIIALLVLLNMRGARRRPRYRPGQPWNNPAVWYEPHPAAPQVAHGAEHDGHAAIGRAPTPALPAGTEEHRAAPGGPLGGARGTW